MDRGTDIFGRVQGWDQAKLAGSKWLVAGAGALGNEVLKNLALLGVGEIWIIDFDRVEPHNLSRSVLFLPENATRNDLKSVAAAEGIHRINPEVKVRYLTGDLLSDLSLGILRRMDVIVGCLDNRIAPMFLNRSSFKVGQCWINAGIEQLEGEVGVFSEAHGCYECRLTDAGKSEIRHRMSCADLARRYAVSGRAVTTPLAASVAASMQITQGLRWLFEGQESSVLGSKFRFNLHAGQFVNGQLAAPGEDCASHFHFTDIIEFENLSARLTLKESLSILRAHFGTDVQLFLDFGVVTAWGDLDSGILTHSVMPRNHLPAILAEENGSVAIPPTHFFDILDQHSPFQEYTLLSLGIPLLQILKVKAGGERYDIELTGDLWLANSSESMLEVPGWLNLSK